MCVAKRYRILTVHYECLIHNNNFIVGLDSENDTFGLVSPLQPPCVLTPLPPPHVLTPLPPPRVLTPLAPPCILTPLPPRLPLAARLAPPQCPCFCHGLCSFPPTPGPDTSARASLFRSPSLAWYAERLFTPFTDMPCYCRHLPS
ncbi:hypothetical protein DPMN_025967 [Dreissena polymorpha]|uniref:Uncharacterized protein n=1 Tax=Dreissena polymorpha TaxID=45954 RepID=A0A9D4LUA0_DREPO|nr:hypothetical protein DPMN_025967 [Dreissena polymorpha]